MIPVLFKYVSSIKSAFKTAERLDSHSLLIYVILSAKQCQWVNAKVCFSDEISDIRIYTETAISIFETLIYYTGREYHHKSPLAYSRLKEQHL